MIRQEHSVADLVTEREGLVGSRGPLEMSSKIAVPVVLPCPGSAGALDSAPSAQAATQKACLAPKQPVLRGTPQHPLCGSLSSCFGGKDQISSSNRPLFLSLEEMSLNVLNFMV